MRMLNRILLLLLGLSLISLVFIGRCGLKLEEELRAAELSSPGSGYSSPSHYLDLLQQQEEKNKRKIQQLQEKIQELHRKLVEIEEGVEPTTLNIKSTKDSTFSEAGCVDYIQKQLNTAELKHGLPLNNEYEVIPFNHFTFSRLYPVELGLGKRVVEKPIGFRRKDLLEIFVRALEVINKERHGKDRCTVDDFVEGAYRNDPSTGSQYELYFKEKNSTHSYHKVTLMRPFGPIQTISKEIVRTSKELINLILPLSGRIDKFRSFMEKFVKVGIKLDKRIFLTVVYFGEDGLQDVRIILTKISRENHFRNIKLLTLNETFSRGKGLQVGAHHWNRANDVILFMCDVDIVFSSKFLERCRFNTIPGKKVYYPIIFSLYNPNIVYSLQGKDIPTESEQLVISRDTGFWRDFGFGMTCQYRSDFINIKGFDEDIIGWGGEDVMLYRKYVRSPLTVVRATDPGIFHIWHEKTCDPNLAVEQYRACLRSRALNEASHAQLGLLAFGDELKQHQKKKEAENPSSVAATSEILEEKDEEKYERNAY
ncbi:chondroitin sulfate N-acetylgalactosaminyltransferase 2-like [Tachypleus tridentatus]|uniref:chondroitin sulfate N-acetylgalactosaminyltransferase 2-like n=1 Tax=Tachypleus tridentatus TaxID=6853 RepID=UPI003FD6551C